MTGKLLCDGSDSNSAFKFDYFNAAGQVVYTAGRDPVSGVTMTDDAYESLALSALFVAAKSFDENEVSADVLEQVKFVGINMGGKPSVLVAEAALSELEQYYEETQAELDGDAEGLEVLEEHYANTYEQLDGVRADALAQGGQGREFSVDDIKTYLDQEGSEARRELYNPVFDMFPG